MSEDFKFPISKELLEPYIKQAISASIVASIGDGTKAIEGAVQLALAQKVDSNGNVSSSSYQNTTPFIEVLARNSIQKVCMEVVNEMAETMRPQIEKQIRTHLTKQSNALCKVLVDGMIGSLSSKWAVQISVNKE